MKKLMVITTVPTKAIAAAIERELISKKLVASVQISGPIESTYWWKGKIQKRVEWMCNLKTTEEKYQKVEKVILKLHPYEVPEIFALKIKKGYSPYLKWIA